MSAILATSGWLASAAPASFPPDEVEYAWWQEPVDQLGEPQRRQRRLLRRLHHDGVAGGQGRRGLAGDEHERVVERHDAADHAERFADREVQPVRTHRDR